MTRADSVHSTPPLSTSNRPPRAPSSQERGEALLMRWRLERAAGIPAAYRLADDKPEEDRQLDPREILADIFEEELFPDPDALAVRVIDRLLDGGFALRRRP